MKILHVTPAYYPATYWGGPIYSVYGLCNALANIPGVTLRVLTADAAGPKRSDSVQVSNFPERYPGGYEVFFCRRLWGASISPGMLFRLWPMIKWADVVHLNGVYSPPTIPTLLICRILGKPVVWSPHGALQRWEGATKPLLKRAWEWACNALVKRGRCILHVTSEQEGADSRARILNATSELIPNGVEIPEGLPDREWLPGGKLRLLYIGRLHPIKGIENLLHALKIFDGHNVSLSIFGSGEESYVNSLKELVRQLGLGGQVWFKGHVDGEGREQAFLGADVCVVPSFSENFGMVVAEALAHGVPVIASKGTPWSGLDNHGCGFWVENDAHSLVQVISRLRGLDLNSMGSCGRHWMKEQYGEDAAAKKVWLLYESLSWN